MTSTEAGAGTAHNGSPPMTRDGNSHVDAPASRFTSAPAWVARSALLALFSLIAYGLLAPPAPVPAPTTAATRNTGDAAYYRDVAQRVRRGDDYYHASADELRRRGGALFPFVTIRPPLLTWFIAAVGGEANAGIALLLLGIASTAAAVLRMRVTPMSRPTFLLAAILTPLSIAVVASAPLFHEAWAGVLIVLALACWMPNRWWISAVIALLASVTRELALPLLLVMLFAAVREQRRREAFAYCFAVLLCAALLTIHAAHVDAVRVASDTHSRSWLSAGGWPFVIRLARDNSLLINCPLWTAAIAVPLGVFGWSSWRHPVAERAALYILGMLVAFTLVGRAVNVYWGLMVGAILPIGIGFAPAGLYAAVNSALRKSLRAAV